MEFLIKFDKMCREIGHPWNGISQNEYVKHFFKKDNDTMAIRKRNEQCKKQSIQYNRQQQQQPWDGRNENIRNNNTRMKKVQQPNNKPLNLLTYIDKLDDNSGATLFVRDPKLQMNDPNFRSSPEYAIRFGKIDFSTTKFDNNSVEILLEPTANLFALQHWEDLFRTTFNTWKQK